MMWLVWLAVSLIAWMLSARANYRHMVTAAWLNVTRYVEPKHRRYGYRSDCPNYFMSSHPSNGWCSQCGDPVTDWEAIRRNRMLLALALGPFLVPALAVKWAVTTRQPVQREEKDHRLAKAEAELAAANKKLDELSK